MPVREPRTQNKKKPLNANTSIFILQSSFFIITSQIHNPFQDQPQTPVHKMPKKFTGVNSKAAAAKARKNER